MSYEDDSDPGIDLPAAQHCPFCGAKAELDLQDSGYGKDGTSLHVVSVQCTACAARMSECRADHPGKCPEELAAELLEQWNRRSPTKKISL